MEIINIIDEDFTNYKKPAMFIATPYCDGKCNRDCGKIVCQNENLVGVDTIDFANDKLIQRYLNNPISKSIVFGGREPFDNRSFRDIIDFLQQLRFNNSCFDDVVIYTGYYPAEIVDKLSSLSKYANIIVKFGRYIPDQPERFDPILGIKLASDNQFAEII